MYEADPFLDQQEIKIRQAKAAEKREEAAASNSSRLDVRKAASSNEFSQSPEVRMATSLRELVEDAIKEVSYPSFIPKNDILRWRPRNFLLTQELTRVATHWEYFPMRIPPSFLPNWDILVSIRPKYEMQQNSYLKALPYPPNYLVLYPLWKPPSNI
jgi:hypothetical protein